MVLSQLRDLRTSKSVGTSKRRYGSFPQKVILAFGGCSTTYYSVLSTYSVHTDTKYRTGTTPTDDTALLISDTIPEVVLRAVL